MKKLYLLLTAMSLFAFITLPINLRAQNSKLHKKKSKTQSNRGQTKGFSPLTQEQKDALQSVINVADSIESNLLSDIKETVSIAESYSVPFTSTELPSPVNKQMREVISTYSDLGKLIGRVYNIGLYESLYKSDIANGKKPYDAMPAILSKYNLQYSNPSEAIQRVHSLAFSARNKLQDLLLNSPTAITKANSTESTQAVDNRLSTSSRKRGINELRNLEDAIGKWQISLISLTGERFYSDFFIEKNMNNFVFVMKKSDGSIYYSSPIEQEDNRYYFEWLSSTTGASGTGKLTFNDVHKTKGVIFIRIKANPDYFYGSYQVTRTQN